MTISKIAPRISSLSANVDVFMVQQLRGERSDKARTRFIHLSDTHHFLVNEIDNVTMIEFVLRNISFERSLNVIQHRNFTSKGVSVRVMATMLQFASV